MFVVVPSELFYNKIMSFNLHTSFRIFIVIARIGGVMVIVFTSSVVDRGFIGGVMVIVLASSEVDREFEPRSGQT
jgi:hypothetical protein